jgi:hypothetical protein
MGAVDSAVSTTLFGGTLELGGSRRLRAGRGYAKVGDGPVIRLQAPYVAPGSIAGLPSVDVMPTASAEPTEPTAGASRPQPASSD